MMVATQQSPYIDDLTGKKIYNMKVISFAGINDKGRSTWLCECDCGNKKIVVGSELKRGKVKSCGCLNKTINGLYKSRLYRIHHLMICRCYTKSTTAYPLYGGRGIKICDDWLGENGFMNFYNWAMTHGYSEKLTIDRIDVDGDYCPENCRWATHEEQSNNTRNNRKLLFDNQTLTISQWSRKIGINRNTLDKRLRSGWTIEDAITKPVDNSHSTR